MDLNGFTQIKICNIRVIRVLLKSKGMKPRIYLLIIAFSLLAVQAHAQELFKDDFSNGMSGWVAEGDFSENWMIGETNLAGGEAPELFYKGKYPITAPDRNCRLVSPVIDLSSYAGQSLIIRFSHTVDHLSPITLGMATTSDGGTTWNSVWTQEQGFEQQMFVRIDNSDIGAAGFRFAFTCSGNFQVLKGWYIDDIQLSIEQDNSIWLESMACEKPSITLKEENAVTLSFKNLGKKNITSMEICYQADGDETVKEIKTGLNVAHFEKASVTFQESIAGKELGKRQIKAWVSKVNGESVTDRELHDTFSVTGVPLPPVRKRAMIEEFTSSTCGPCAILNAVLDPWLQTAKDEVVATKYQMFFPQPVAFPNGDPYFIEDCDIRSEFYGSIRAVPTPFLDGTEFPSGASHEERVRKVKEMVSKMATEQGMVDIKAIFSVTGKSIKTEIHLMPYVSGDYLLNVAINEKTTTENVGSNGETAFHSVLMKMFPDGNGKTYSFMEGKAIPLITFEEDLSDTNIEEFDDLEIAVFVQDPVSKAILNAVYATATTISPNPPTSLKAVAEGTTVNLSWEKPSPGTGLTGYTLYRDGALVAENITGTSYSDTQLMNENYTYHLKAIYPEMESVYASCSAIVEVPVTPPANVEATTHDHIRFTVTWDASPEEYIEGYDIYREGTKINQDLVTTTSYTDDVLYEGGYCYRIVAVAPMGESKPSDRACAGTVAIDDTATDSFLKVYPNPASGQLHIANDKTSIKNIRLFDLSSRLVYEKSNVNATEYTIDISTLTHGLYILNVDEKAVKLIKQ